MLHKFFHYVLRCLLCIFCLTIPAGVSADPLNLESGLPISIEDAYVTPFQNREYQGFLRLETGEDKDQLEVVQRLELGVWYNTELTVEAPFVFGEAVEDGYGDTSVEILYNLNQETRTLPAISFGATLITPTGKNSEGVDPEVEAILTKTLPGTWDLHRLHLNGGVRFNDDMQKGERGDLYHVVAGYQYRATNQIILLADVLRQEELEEDIEMNVVEGGARIALTPYSVFAIGIGHGFGADSPKFRGSMGLQFVLF